jgi:2-amino-4-hydroxy-6-hydroxymethyldihydropteridine diphosphokinase
MNSRNSIIRGTLAELKSAGHSPICFVGFGANLRGAAGGSQHSVLAAFAALLAESRTGLVVSSLWQTTPLDCPPDSPLFVNAVAAFVPLVDDAHALLQRLQALEAEAGRQRVGLRNAARPLDLDILLFGQQECATADLILPHPRMAERRFVLAPLAEIAPDLRVPGQAHTVSKLLQALPEQGEMRRIETDLRAVVF